MLFLASAVQTATVELVRGAPLGNPGYWAVADAYLDKAEPAEDHGGGFTLLGGDDRTILIRFGDLARAIGPNRRITSATLVLTPSGGDVPKLKGVTAVDAPWGEGPWSSLARIISNIESDPKGTKKPTAPRGAATWNERRAGIAAWATPGVAGGASVAAMGGLKEKTFEVSGLAAAVQGWVDRPWANNGLALDFEGAVEFFSSQSPSGRPRLVLTTEPVITTMQTKPDLAVVSIAQANGAWTARIRNIGSGPAPAVKATWWTDGKAGGMGIEIKGLAPGAETNVAYVGPSPKDDPQVPNLALTLDVADANPANDRLDVFTGAKAVTLRLKPGLDPQGVVQVWNETVAPGSRYSFAPEGAKVRVRLESATVADDGVATLAEGLRQIGTQLGLPSTANGGDLYPGLMGYGDTRYEGTIPGRLVLPYEPYADPATETALLEPTGLLSATDVGRLNDPGSPLPLPKAALIRVTDLVGRPLGGLKLTLEGAGSNASALVTGPGGTVALPATVLSGFKSDLSNGTLTLRGSLNGLAASASVKAWRLSDAFRRSGSPVVLMDVRMDLPAVPLESETDLARDKTASDSAGDEPAKLVALNDGDDATVAPLPAAPGAWVEIDLGRDRTIGEIALRLGPEFWRRYEIRAYTTGGRREDAEVWATELDSAWTRRNRSVDGWITYRAPVQRVRFIQIVSKSGGPAALAGLRVVPVKLQTGAGG